MSNDMRAAELADLSVQLEPFCSIKHGEKRMRTHDDRVHVYRYWRPTGWGLLCGAHPSGLVITTGVVTCALCVRLYGVRRVES